MKVIYRRNLENEINRKMSWSKWERPSSTFTDQKPVSLTKSFVWTDCKSLKLWLIWWKKRSMASSCTILTDNTTRRPSIATVKKNVKNGCTISSTFHGPILISTIKWWRRLAKAVIPKSSNAKTKSKKNFSLWKSWTNRNSTRVNLKSFKMKPKSWNCCIIQESAESEKSLTRKTKFSWS